MRKSHIAFFISLALYATLFLAFMQTKLIFTVAGLSTVALSAFIPFFLLALCIDEVDDENY